MRTAIKKSYIMLLSAATVSAAALAVGAYPFHAGAWKNSAIEGLQTLWETKDYSGLFHGEGNEGGKPGFQHIVDRDVDFTFLWSSAAMKTLGLLPSVTFSRDNGAGNSGRMAGPVSSASFGTVLAALTGNEAMKYLAGTTAYFYGFGNPPLLSAGTITDPTRTVYAGELPTPSVNNNPPAPSSPGQHPSTPTPLPSALPLLGSGLACLEVLRRIRKV